MRSRQKCRFYRDSRILARCDLVLVEQAVSPASCRRGIPWFAADALVGLLAPDYKNRPGGRLQTRGSAQPDGQLVKQAAQAVDSCCSLSRGSSKGDARHGAYQQADALAAGDGGSAGEHVVIQLADFLEDAHATAAEQIQVEREAAINHFL